MKDIRKVSEQDLATLLLDNKEPKFRAKQIYEWIWKKNVHSFDEMTNISKSLRQLLQQHFYFTSIEVVQEQISSDGTVKLVFQLYDGKKVEGVIIPTIKRITACISSQVGCSLDCDFCATGKMKMQRNLDAAEIVDQVAIIQKKAQELYQRPLTNIVYMGMGEPLLNYNAVMESFKRITSPEGLGLSTKRVTISTAGISKMIKKMADDNIKAKLAVSLHAPGDEKRSQIMSINDQNDLKSLREALTYYYDKMKQYITFEYVMLKDFNDTIEDARNLVTWCRKIPCKVNLIEYNSTAGKYAGSDASRTKEFEAFLVSNDIPTSTRRSRGVDIDAACGQLAIKDKSTPLKK